MSAHDNGASVNLAEKLRRTYDPFGYCKVDEENGAWNVRWDGEWIGGWGTRSQAIAMASGADEVLGRVANALGVFGEAAE